MPARLPTHAPALLALALACAGTPPAGLGLHDGRLASCPSSPNCVSSLAAGAHQVEPLRLSGNPAQAWPRVLEAVRELPRTEIVSTSGPYAHAQSTSLLLRFVDDLELGLDAAAGVVHVRSASRVGYSDLGANRRRVERLRASLRERGVVD